MRPDRASERVIDVITLTAHLFSPCLTLWISLFIAVSAMMILPVKEVNCVVPVTRMVQTVIRPVISVRS